MTGWFLSIDEDTGNKGVLPDDQMVILKAKGTNDEEPQLITIRLTSPFTIQANPVTNFNENPSHWLWHTTSPQTMALFVNGDYSEFVKRFENTELPSMGLVLIKRGEKLKEKPVLNN